MRKISAVDILSKEKSASAAAGSHKEAETSKNAPMEGKRSSKKEESSQTPLPRIIESVTKIIADRSDDEEWVLASKIGHILGRLYPEFDARNYGYKNLSDLLKNNGFETKAVSNEGKPKLIYVNKS